MTVTLQTAMFLTIKKKHHLKVDYQLSKERAGLEPFSPDELIF